MSKVFILVLIYGGLISSCCCYANTNSEREEEALREREANDFYDGDSNDVGDKGDYKDLDDESRPRESDEGDAYDDFQRDAEVAENEDDDEPVTRSFYKKELMDTIYYRRKDDPGCSRRWLSCSHGCCLRGWKCMDCKKELYFLCGTYLFPPKTGSRMPTATRPTRDQSDWMKKYSSKKLRDIVMPGSHHSGIYNNPNSLNKWDIPQTMSVASQLKAGVRFMDVRVATGPELHKPYVVHTFKYQDLQKVIISIVNFLKKHQSEVVIIRLKKGDGFAPKWEVNWKDVDSVLQNYENFLYTEKRSPMWQKLSKLGGKIIICQESKKSSFKTLTCKGSWVSTHTNNPDKLPNKMTEWLNKGKSSRKFNYLEAICTAEKVDVFGVGCKRDGDNALERFHSIKEMASASNSKVYKWLKEYNIASRRVNSVMTDFVNPKILNYIINSNK